MTMAPRSGQVVDQNNVPVVGAKIYVYDLYGNLASLTSNGTTPIGNPLTTDVYGAYAYQALVGYYNEDIWFGGQKRDRENNVAVGSPGADLALRTDLAAAGGVSLVTGAAKTDFSNVTGANRLLTDDNLFNPIGNGTNTHGRWNTITADSRNDIREFMFSFGADFSHGTAGTGSGGAGEKALLYAGAIMHPGSFKAWALNGLLNIQPSVAVEYANVAELDIDNASGVSFGTGIGSAGLSAPSVYGLTINGANVGVNTVTGAVAVLSSATGAIYERGYVVGPTSVVQAAFDDYSSATYSLRDLGTHTIGLELRGTYATAAIRIPNNKLMIARNAAGSGDVSILRVDATNNVVLGDGAAAPNMILCNHLLPETDATKQIGSATNRYAEIHGQRLVLYPPGSVTPATNGELRIELTSNTTLTIRVKGSDGTVRSVALTLA